MYIRLEHEKFFKGSFSSFLPLKKISRNGDFICIGQSLPVKIISTNVYFVMIVKTKANRLFEGLFDNWT